MICKFRIVEEELQMAMLYGALAVFPLGWATAGYVLVSRAPLAIAQKGMPR
jgi:hypothetical protein